MSSIFLSRMNKRQIQAGITLFEVVVYVALLGVVIAIIISTLVNIFATAQKQIIRAQSDNSLITFIATAEELIRTEEFSQIETLNSLYEPIITDIELRYTAHNLELHFNYIHENYIYYYEQ